MKSIGFLGAGNMAEALIQGFLAKRLCRASDVRVSDPLRARKTRMRRRFRIRAERTNRSLVAASDVVMLAVKPQVLSGVLDEIRGEVARTKLFVSIAAGTPLGRLEEGLGGAARVVRVMPNTPALLGRGMSVVVRGRCATRGDEAFVLRLFRSVGEAVAVADERLLDPVTGLSGSGPAFVYLFAEALLEGGVRSGLPRGLAAKLAFRTIEGAAAMLLESGQAPEDLRRMVSSPGGTTLAGLAHLEREGFRGVVAGAVEAATRRSQELARGR